MEEIKQVQLLLRRNVALRLRQPVVLALELFWPVVIFLVVMVARNAIPPVAQPTCYYKAWALPSAGVVPFVQSMICNIDDCQNETQYEDIPSYPGSSVRELVENTMPLIMDQNITELVGALPKGIRLMRAAVDALSGPDLSALLGDGFPVKNLLKDTNQTRELLRHINITRREMDIILNSSIQLPQILEITSQRSFCEAAPASVSGKLDSVGILRRSLCTIDDASRNDFFRQLRNQLDVRNIVQTMGLAMSELGRLDVSEILENIASFLSSVQSSDILSADLLTMLATLMEEIHFEEIDTEAISLLIDDLEPLYRHSQWADLINVLKDLKFNTADSATNIPSNRRMDLPDNMHITWSQSQNVNKITAAKKKNSSHNSSNILDTVLEMAETGVDVARLMPRQKVQHIQSALKYFTVLVEIVDELTRSLEIETSSNFIDHLSDVLGAVLLNVAQEATPTGKNMDRQLSGRRLCDPEYFLKNISSTDWKNTEALQNYACRISKVIAQRRSSGYEGDEWQFPSDKIRRIFSQRTSSEIQHNIKRWENEDIVSNPKRTGLLSPHQTENETSVDDLVSAAECAVQGLKDILVQADDGSNSTNENTLMVSEDVSKQVDNLKEKWVLTSISRVKEVAKDFRESPLMQMNLSSFDLQKLLSTVYSMLNKATAHNPAGVSATANELVRLLPAFLFVSRELNTTATLINGIPNLISAFVDDLEPLVWKSIVPDKAEDFTKTGISKNFCISVSRSVETHWKGMLCEKDTSAFKLYLPTESTKKQDNFTKFPSSNWNTRTKFNSQTFARILLELSSGVGSVFKVMAKVLKPVPGCENTCGNDDVVLKKICFLTRLQNVKSMMDNDSDDTEDDVINELRPYFTLNENILEAYNIFVDTAHSTASNNYTDDRDIVRLVVSGVRLLESFGGEEHILRPALHVANSLISLLKNRVSDAAMYNETSVVQIQNVFPDSPLTQELANNLLPLLPEVTSTFFWTVLAPGELLNLVSANDKNISVIMATVCNSSLSRYLYNPTLDQAGFRKLSEALCRHSYYDIFEEIFQDPDIQEIVFEAGNTDEVTWEDMQENLLDIIDLLEELAAVRKADLSALPPPTKWQKMGINIYTKAQDPSVLLYIVTNRMFHGFCNYTSSKLPYHLQSFIPRDKEIALYHELCSMSKESFAKKVVRNLNQTIKASSPNSMQSFDMAIIAQRFWETLADISEIKRVAKFVLDLDLLDHYETAGLSAASESMEKRKIFQKKIMNATLRAYDMVDKMTDGMLSLVILGSAVPEVMQQISSYVIESGGHISLRTVFENEKDSRRLLSSLFRNDPERKKLESYIDILAEYFSRLENLSTLKTLCNEHQKNERLDYTADSIIKKLCLQPPLEWSPISLTENKHNLTALWLQINEFLNDEVRNKTRELYFAKRKSGLLHSINETLESGVDISDWSSIQTSSFHFSLMRALVKNLEDVLQTVPERLPNIVQIGCVTKSAEVAIQESTRRLFRSIPDLEFITCHLLNKNISAFYSWMSKSSRLKDAFQKMAKAIEEGENCTHSVTWLIKVIDNTEVLYNKISSNVSEEVLSRVNKCLENINQSPLIVSLKTHSSLLKQAAKFLSTLSSPAKQWRDVKEQIIQEISQNLPAFFEISEVIQNVTLLLFPNLETDDERLVDIVLRSSMNFNWLQYHGFSSSALREKLCGLRARSSIRSVFRYPPRSSLAIRAATEEFLCRNGTLEYIMDHIDQEIMKTKIRKAQEQEFFSGRWLQHLIGSSDVLVHVVEYLGTSLKEIHILNIYDIFHLFTKQDVVQGITESFSKLIEVLEPVFTGSALLDTLEQVMDGLKSFLSLAQVANFSFTYSLKDVFGEGARDILMRRFRMDPRSVSSLMESEVDLKQAKIEKNSSLVNFCRDSLDQSIPCVLSSYRQASVSVEHLQDLVLQRFLFSFGSLGVEGVLREADVNAVEAERTLEVLSSAPEVVNKLTHHLETVTTMMHPEVRELFQKLDEGTDWLATPEALSIGGQILCGKPLTSLSRKFSLLAPEDTENKIEEKELLRLPSEFCRHGYKEIMKMRGGAILWGFLKPLFRGKILYSPKDFLPAVTIISKVNETLKLLEDQMRFVKAAAEGSTGLHYLQRKNETLISLQKFLASKPVSKLLGSPSWGAALSWLEAPKSTGRSLLHLVELVGNVTQCISLNRFLGFDTEEELEAAAATLHDRREFIAAIVFLNEKEIKLKKRWTHKPYRNNMPKDVLYKIRMDIDNVPTTEYIKYRWWRPYPYDDFFEDLRYFRGFLQLQDTVDTAIMQLQTNSDGPQNVKKYLQQFPYPCHQRDKFGTLLKGSMPAVMTISWVFIVALLVRERVLDRELELDETLRVMGLKGSAGWLAWFVTGVCVLLVSVIGIVLVLKWGGITPNSDPIILFLFVLDFAILLIAYCQLMSAFFTRATTAALMSVLLYVLSFFPFLLFVTWELDFLYWQKLLSCALVSTSFCFGCLYLNRYEDQGQGVQWSNLWHSPVAEDRMNFGTTLMAMVLCSMGYFLISWYFTRIWAGSKERKPLTWYFFMSGQKYPEKSSAYHNDDYESKGKTEGDSSSQRGQNVKKTVGISVKNVHGLYTKRGSNEWKALCGLNLDLCEDHITALLGHNGAGKTTTIKILTGRMSPTAGSVTVYGLPIPEKTAEVRKLIGFCPQNNTLYAKLTVREHLYLFAQLKGLLNRASIDEDVEQMLQSLNLVEKQHQSAEVLSGGQRRRLCVGIAFIGGSKVIILDEPTSSVDPVARRSIWDLILKYKKGRTIMLTTHHLDEADILSDRVAILHKGRMLCYGSPLQLKSRFGSGYRLSLFVGAEKTEREDRDSGRASSITEYEEPINVDCDGVMEFIQSYVPDATLLENDESHLVVSLPVEPLTRKPLSEFFAHLEKCLHLWGFQNSSLSSATLEEVFLTLCRLEDAKEAHKSDYASDISPFFLKNPNDIPSFSLNKDECHKDCVTSFSVEMSGKDKSSEKEQFLEGAALKFSQLKSLVKKRYWHTKRNWKALTSSILMPCLFIALAMALAVGKPQKKPDPSIELKPSLYSSHGQKAVSFFAFEEQQPRLGTVLLDALKVNMSSKQICNQQHAECRLHGDKYGRSAVVDTPESRCLCEAECPTDRQEPSSSLLSSDQTLYNVSGLDVPRYLLNSYLQFNERRYGGWSMKKESDEVVTKVWFENSGYHAAPSYLNTLNNAILKNSTGRDFNIRTWSHPLRLSVEQLGRETLLQRLGEVGIAFVFLIGLSLVPSTFAVYVVGERESEQKRLQMVTGALGPLMYWGSAVLWDLTIVLVTSLISAAIVGAFALPAFYQRENFRAVYALIFLYGWATTPLTYLCSRFFHEGSLAFMVIFTSHLFVGLVIMMALVSLRMISISKDIAVTLELVQKVSLAFPQYSLVGGLTDLNENQIRTEIFDQFGQDVYVSPFSWNSLGPNYVSLFIQGLLFFLLTLLLEILPLKHWCQRLIFGRKRPVMSTVTEDDSKYLLQIQNVSQVYPSKAGNKYAVDNLSLNIPVGECFGLVGANGAGKTTLFRLLIGEIRPTSGRILRVGSESKAYEKHRFLGYCPQKDALDPLLTARQHLEVYAGLRGIHPSQIQKLVDHSLQSLELSIHADCPVRTLSGGTKRKLCTAIATMGDPELVLLDEPTSGMDPGTRRLVWRSISQATEAGRSVILTSHSIEDCDVLCSRLGIMVNGKIACLDSPAKLKARLGTGYTISFRIPEDSEDLSSLLNFIHKEMPTAHIQVRSRRRVEITLPDEKLTLSNLFCHLEECAKLFGIEDLAIDPTTLDQVFVTFVRQQSDASERNFHSISQIPAHENEPHLDMCCTKL